MTARTRRGDAPRRRSIARPVGAVIGGALALALLGGGWIGWRANEARQELNQAQALLPTLRAQLASQDLPGAEATAVKLSGHTAEARRLTGDPVWRVAAFTPVVGQDLRTVSTMSAAADDVSQDVALPLILEADGLDVTMLTASDGRFDLSLIESKSGRMHEIGTRLTEIVDDVEATSDSSLLGPVGTARTSFLTQLRELDGQMSAMDAALQVLPGMLGGDGPRTYLVLFQNNAEVRALGGMPGAFAVVRAEDGAVTMVSQGGPGDLGTFEQPTSPLPEGMVQMFGDEPGIYFQNVNFTPNWAWAAPRYREMYTASTGQQIDGVIAADPVTASYLLPAGSTLDINGTRVAPERVVQQLLNQVYLDLPGQNPAQNAVYEAVAAATFAQLSSGAGDPGTLIAGLGKGVDEGRVLVWSAHQQEQAVLDDTAVSGPLRPAGTGGDGEEADASSPVIGVFYNAAIPSKMDYYLQPQIELSSPMCSTGENVRRELRITLRNDAPANAGTALPADIVGPADYITPGQNRVQVLVYVPPGSALGEMKVNGSQQNYGTAQDAGWNTGLMVATIDPQSDATITFAVDTPNELNGIPVVRTTPTSTSPVVTVDEKEAGLQKKDSAGAPSC